VSKNEVLGGAQPSSANERSEFVKAARLPKEIVFDIPSFLHKAKKPYHYEIVGDWKTFDLVLYISALSPNGKHFVKFEKRERSTNPFAEDELKKIAESIGATPGRWC
jgi:hypothetical protein